MLWNWHLIRNWIACSITKISHSGSNTSRQKKTEYSVSETHISASPTWQQNSNRDSILEIAAHNSADYTKQQMTKWNTCSSFDFNQSIGSCFLMLQFLVVEGLDRYASCCFFRASCYTGIMDALFIKPHGVLMVILIFLQQHRLSYQKRVLYISRWNSKQAQRVERF